MSSKSCGAKIPFRKNVIALMLIAYGTVLVMFLGMALTSSINAVEAWDALEAPLMALIGGSLTLSYNLIDDNVSAVDDGSEQEPQPDDDAEK